MTAPTPRSIEDVPLHVVASILGQLDTIHQLKVTTSSHSTFREAFKDNVRSTTQSVVANEIPEDILPFSLALLESSQADFDDSEAVAHVMKNLKDRVDNPGLASRHLADLTLPDFEFLSRQYTAVKSLGERFCRDSFPLFTKWLGPSTTVEAGPRDHFRIHRALYRHQIMCDLLCRRSKNRARDEEVDGPKYKEDRARAKMVLLAFSPWVNEQLVCVYFFLQRLVMEAYDDVAAHDITWGELPIAWTEEEWWVDPDEDGVQQYLAHGLEFLNLLANAKTFDDRAALFGKADSERATYSVQFDAYPHTQMTCLPYYSEPLWTQGLEGHTPLARAHELGVLSSFASSLDGLDEPLSSTSFRTWLTAQSERQLASSTFEHSFDANLWTCGYVIWESCAEVPADQFQEKIVALRQEEHFFQRLRASVDDDDVERSENMRTDLYFAGAKGFWPLKGIDFSGVRNLDEVRKQRILERWKADPDRYLGNALCDFSAEELQSAVPNEDET